MINLELEALLTKNLSSSSLSDALKEKKKDKTPFLTEEEENELKKNEQQQQESKSSANQVPSKLTCPFVEHGVHIIKDAVLIPCCGHFICCDECIREKISGEEIVDCPMKDCGHEIDSLESITSHHQMRSMVNEYLNDVKLNKFNNNNNNKKKDDLFIDLLLNDDFETNSLSIENPVNELNSKQSVVVVDVKNEEKESLNEKGEELVQAKSPLQDSNISSTIPLNKALLPTPPSPLHVVTATEKVSQCALITPANNIQRIATLSKPPPHTMSQPLYVADGYSYNPMVRPPIMPNKIRRMPNNISIPIHPHQMPHHQIRGPIMHYGGMQGGYEMSNYHQTNYYPPYQQSSQYPPNPPVYHQQPHIHAYNAGMSNNYGPPFMSNTNMPVGSMPQKQLSEKEFYEMKERILKRE